MHARHTHVLTRVQLTSTLPKSRRNHSMVVANYSPVGKTQQKTRKLHFKFPLPKMTPHECHMLKINVQLCILLLLHLFSSVHIGPYNCFFSSMNKSKLNLKMNFIWRKRRINFDSVYQIVYAQIVRSSSDSLSL